MNLQDVELSLDESGKRMSRMKIGVFDPSELEFAVRDPSAFLAGGGLEASDDFTLDIHATLELGSGDVAEALPQKCWLRCDVDPSTGKATNCEIISCGPVYLA